jgi:hypothetical protein
VVNANYIKRQPCISIIRLCTLFAFWPLSVGCTYWIPNNCTTRLVCPQGTRGCPVQLSDQDSFTKGNIRFHRLLQIQYRQSQCGQDRLEEPCSFPSEAQLRRAAPDLHCFSSTTPRGIIFGGSREPPSREMEWWVKLTSPPAARRVPLRDTSVPLLLVGRAEALVVSALPFLAPTLETVVEAIRNCLCRLAVQPVEALAVHRLGLPFREPVALAGLRSASATSPQSTTDCPPAAQGGQADLSGPI